MAVTVPIVNDRWEDSFFFQDEFIDYVDGTLWTKVADTNGTVSTTDSVGGVVTLADQDGIDNNECYLKSDCECVKFGDGLSFSLRGRMKFSEVATNAANIIFGAMDAVTVNTLVDNGGGIRATGDAVAIYKIDGGTKWVCKTQLNGTSYGNTTTTITAGGSYQNLEIRFSDRGGSGSNCGRVEYFINSQLVASHEMNTYTSATEMEPVFGLKNGSGAAQSLLVDYFGVRGVRQA